MTVASAAPIISRNPRKTFSKNTEPGQAKMSNTPSRQIALGEGCRTWSLKNIIPGRGTFTGRSGWHRRWSVNVFNQVNLVKAVSISFYYFLSREGLYRNCFQSFTFWLIVHPKGRSWGNIHKSSLSLTSAFYDRRWT